jgi:hypothetical protein
MDCLTRRFFRSLVLVSYQPNTFAIRQYLADFTAVHERRVEIGIDGDPPSFPMATNNDPSTTPLTTPPTTPSSTGNDHGTCPACRLTKRKSYVRMASALKRRRKSSKRTATSIEKPSASANLEALANKELVEV